MDNAVSCIRTEPEVLGQLRTRISYREKFLPPPHIQAIVRQVVDPSQLKWSPQDILFNSSRAGQLWAEGWGTSRLDDQLIADIVMSSGLWDGWRTQISEKGWFGTGLVPMVERALKLHMGREVKITDKRVKPEANTPAAGPPLWDHQQEAVDSFFGHGGRGVMNVP